MKRVLWYRAVITGSGGRLVLAASRSRATAAAAAADPVVLVGRENIAVADSAAAPERAGHLGLAGAEGGGAGASRDHGTGGEDLSRMKASG